MKRVALLMGVTLAAGCGGPTDAAKLATYEITLAGSVVETGAYCSYVLNMNGTHVLSLTVSSDGSTSPGFKDTTITLPAPGNYAAHEMMVEASPSLGNVAGLSDYTATVPGAHISTCPTP